jgi:hypothetical protein
MGEKERGLLKLVCLPLKELAKEIDVGYGNIRNWTTGRAPIPSAYRAKLVQFIRKHVKRLEKAADELERDSE